MAKLLLIDGDLVCFRCAFAVEHNMYLSCTPDIKEITTWEDKKSCDEFIKGTDAIVWHRKQVEPVENAIALVDNVLKDIQDRYADWAGFRVYLSPSVGNFRDTLATRAKYKGNRDGTPRPVHYSAVRQHLISKWGAVVSVGEEADDSIGIAMQSNPGSVCVSFDKDMLQLAGRHYDWVTKSERAVTAKEAGKFFWQQALSGDATDNIPGCKGIGEVKATKLLADCKSNAECWDKVLEVYKEVHGDEGEAFATETARLVYVRRKNNEMWSPPK
jgi:DNA polymerase-1